MKKRTYFTLKDIVSFGNYLLSKEREQRFKDASLDNLEERLRFVHHADIANWKFNNNK